MKYTLLDNMDKLHQLFIMLCDDIAFNGAPVTPIVPFETQLKVKGKNGKVLSFKATKKVDGLLLYGHTFEPLTVERAYEIIKVRLY